MCSLNFLKLWSLVEFFGIGISLLNPVLNYCLVLLVYLGLFLLWSLDFFSKFLLASALFFVLHLLCYYYFSFPWTQWIRYAIIYTFLCYFKPLFVHVYYCYFVTHTFKSCCGLWIFFCKFLLASAFVILDFLCYYYFIFPWTYWICYAFLLLLISTVLN